MSSRKTDAQRKWLGVGPDMRDLPPITITDVSVYRETMKAIFMGQNERIAQWFPKSQCIMWPNMQVRGKAVISAWIAQQKGIEEGKQDPQL